MHEDVRKALDATCDATGGDDDNDRELVRTAILAFHRAMPDWQGGDAGLVYVPSRIVQELEQ